MPEQLVPGVTLSADSLSAVSNFKMILLMYRGLDVAELGLTAMRGPDIFVCSYNWKPTFSPTLRESNNAPFWKTIPSFS